MPRAEGWAGGRKVRPDEEAVMMGAAAIDYKEGVWGKSTINGNSERDKLPKMTQEELAWLNSADIGKAAEVEEVLKKRMEDCGLNPEREGIVKLLVDDKEIEMAIGSDFGTIVQQ